METVMMSLIVYLGVLLTGLLSGCQTVEQAQQAEARRQVEQRYAEERALHLQGELDAVLEEQVELRRDLEQLRIEVRGATAAAQTAQEQARQAEAQQAKVVTKVQNLLKKELVAGPTERAVRGRGHEHVVESGHTLSAIAVAYGSTVQSIKEVNQLSSDNIYIGQKLFIPE
ncbi:MAG: LysM peptidoglycan-binding domain-containing protein [Coraliomargaritaceae bacterium]